MSLEGACYAIDRIETINGNKVVEKPTEVDNSEVFGLCIEKTKVDKLMLDSALEFQPSDMGIVVYSNQGKITIEFDKDKFRPADVPMLLSRTAKIQQLGFQIKYSLRDIINDQLNYFLDPSR